MTARALQQQIHMACRDLGLDAETRHDIQIAACGKASMRNMSEADLQLVLGHLKQRGWKGGFKPASKGRGTRPLAPRKDLRLVHVLWKKLGEKDALRDPSREGLNKFIRARFGKHWQSVPADIDMLREWEKIDAVIQALKSWGERADIDFDWAEHQR